MGCAGWDNRPFSLKTRGVSPVSRGFSRFSASPVSQPPESVAVSPQPERPAATPLRIEFPESLPVSARRDEIMAAMAQHQVIIVCGETGSGKTTQLPKMALALGRGKLNARAGERPRLIGHTQPRRIAATSVAKRIADELHTPLGDVVGYKVRFNDRLSRHASVKLMTDGILLAETQGDPLLQAYDTLIIDEAHERSLNIDFLLGYLRQILPRRPDLKIIVTSATIDADRFARHFASASGPAPVIMVSGRTYPVEVRWRPFEETREYGLDQAIAEAVDELWRNPQDQGDILVFLPGEREIREAADHLRQHLSHVPTLRGTDVLPLFARLSQAEQDRVFDNHSGRRIVLATNVAETSLTVPGIRYVIDSGTARVKRYSYRSKVEQLLVEPISQAAAQQRSGRCGRVADGICIRLYDEQDFNGRARFTDPEILRSSLAGVILRMKSLHLGDVEGFPFVEAPRPKAISDGYQLLAELGAVDEHNELTPIGRDLAHWPLDPRVGRMVLEARQRQSLAEVLIVASALSVQDVRDRPLAQQAQADQAQAQFKDERSEFSGYLTLWAWLERQRGGGGHAKSGAVAQASATPTHKLSNRQFEQVLRQHFINPRRLREWRDVYSQLLTVVNQQGWHLNTQPASYEQLHCSMLAGLLGNIGWRQEDEEGYLGARGIRFYKHPGAQLRKKPGRWVVCAELVETTRLFGRGIANIEPRWLEEVGAHLLRKQVLDPKWDRRQAEVQGMERATLYGLVVYSGRRVPYARVDLTGAREIFIREALVEGQWETDLPFLAANRQQIRKVMDLEHKSRRQDVLVDEALIYAFYDQQLPSEVCNGKTLERWYRQASRDITPGQPAPLLITQAELMRHEAAGVTTEAFPKMVRLGGVDCAAQYLHEPGDPRDGLTITVPLFVLNQVSEERTEWLVPGMLKEKIQALLKSLPQKPRARLVPLPDSAARLADELSVPEVFGHGSLYDALQARVKAMVQLDIKRSDFKADMVSPHLFLNLRLVDDHGRQLAQGRNLGAIKAQWGSQARGAFQALAALRSAVPSSESSSVDTTKVTMPVQAPSAKSTAQIHAASSTSSTSAVRGVSSASSSAGVAALSAEQRYTQWGFGELPELMEIRKGSQTLVGFPALVDQQDAVTIEVFDEPELAVARHRGGLRRLFALQIRDALKYLEKNIPGWQAMVMAFMQVGKRADGSGGGTADELLAQLLEVSMDRAFLLEPLPHDEASFQQRLQEGRGRLNLIAQEVARLCATLMTEYTQVLRKLKDTRGQPEVVEDMQQQLQRLMGKRFLTDTPFAQLQHFARYLKAMQLRLDKLRADPARDAAKRAELKPLDQRYWRLVAERKGVMDERSREYRWLLEELRVSFFAQELRTPQPVSVKRLDKAWALLTQ